jgi:uncharacterized membrane protein YfcA
MTAGQHVAFIACVALASYVQNLTGFALGLVLLGLVGLLHLAPLPDVTNAVSILALLNAALLLRAGLPRLHARTLVPTVAASLAGVCVGVVLLTWLSDNVVLGLRLLLGLTIAGAAVLLVVSVPRHGSPSAGSRFAAVGLVSGVLGGLFSTAGPPLVYHYYRQPMKLEDIRAALVIVFALNAALRLVLLGGAGRVELTSVWLSLEAAPVVLAVTWWVGRHPPPWSARVVKRIVAALLGVVALSLGVPAARELLGALAGI